MGYDSCGPIGRDLPNILKLRRYVRRTLHVRDERGVPVPDALVVVHRRGWDQDRSGILDGAVSDRSGRVNLFLPAIDDTTHSSVCTEYCALGTEFQVTVTDRSGRRGGALLDAVQRNDFDLQVAPLTEFEAAPPCQQVHGPRDSR